MKEGAGSMLIRGGSVLLEAAGAPGGARGVEILEGLDVLVSGDRIAYVGPTGSAPAAATCVEYDATGQVVMPGFVNGHTHCSMTLLRGYAQDMTLDDWLRKRIWPAEGRMTPEDIHWGALLGCVEMIAAGVTSFCDMYFKMDGVAEAVEASGLRALLSQGMAGLNQADRRRTWDASLELYHRWNGGAGGRIRVILGPHAPYTCPPDFLEEVGRLSTELGVQVTIHLAETRDEVEECLRRHGKTPVRLAFDSGLASVGMIAAHCVHAGEEDVRLLGSPRAAAVHCPVSNLNLACGIAPVARMLTAGVTVALGTDGPASGSTHEMFTAMRLATLAQKHLTGDPTALPATRALWMATRGGALALGLGDTGAIREGMKADMICVSTKGPHFQPGLDAGACLVHCARPEDVRLVMVDGRVLKKDDQVLTLDEEVIRREVEARAKRIVKSA
ncbi:MAG: amidohydrolase [Firmicutes bacterium]|nr:amidohydrolase [Bacillota bacterium]